MSTNPERTLLILAASDELHVAAWLGSTLLQHFSSRSNRQTASVLAGYSATCLEQLGGLDVLAVVNGPGSWSGTRTSVAMAKGIGLATSAKLLAVPFHDVVFAAMPATESTIALQASDSEAWVARYIGNQRVGAVEQVLRSDNDQQARPARWGRFERGSHALLDVSTGRPLLENGISAASLYNAHLLAREADGFIPVKGLRCAYMPAYPTGPKPAIHG